MRWATSSTKTSPALECGHDEYVPDLDHPDFRTHWRRHCTRLARRFNLTLPDLETPDGNR